jgi:hypothetical protein
MHKRMKQLVVQAKMLTEHNSKRQELVGIRWVPDALANLLHQSAANVHTVLSRPNVHSLPAVNGFSPSCNSITPMAICSICNVLRVVCAGVLVKSLVTPALAAEPYQPQQQCVPALG